MHEAQPFHDLEGYGSSFVLRERISLPINVSMDISMAEIFHGNEEGPSLLKPSMRPHEASIVLVSVRTIYDSLTSREM